MIHDIVASDIRLLLGLADDCVCCDAHEAELLQSISIC
jgi:hypothetical protein